MTRILLISLLLGGTNLLLGQVNSEIDSLQKLLTKTKEASTERVDVLNKLAIAFGHQDSSRRYEYSMKAMELARKKGYVKGEVDARSTLANEIRKFGLIDSSMNEFARIKEQAVSIGYVEGEAVALTGLSNGYFVKGDFLKSIDLNEQAVGLLKPFGNSVILTRCYINLASCFSQVGNVEEALNYFHKASRAYRDLGDRRGLVLNYLNLGVFYYHREQPEKALFNYRKSLNLNRSSYISEEAVAQNNMGLVFEEANQLDSAEYYYKKSIESAEKVNYLRLRGWSYNGMAKVEIERGNFQTAKQWLDKALEIRMTIGNGFELAKTYITFGDNLMMGGKPSEAEKYYLKALETSVGIDDLIGRKDALKRLMGYYFSIDSFKKAFEFQSRYMELKDSLLSDDQLKKMTVLEAEYRFSAERDSVAFERQKERLLLESEIENRRLSQTILIMVLFFTILMAVVAYFSYMSIKRSNHQLRKLNVEISVQRDELKELNEMKARLFAIVSHDLRSPIDQLYSFGFLMRRRIQSMDSHDLEDVFREFDYSYNNLRQLMDNVLDWGLIDVNSGKLPKQGLKMDEVLDRCIAVCEPFAQSKDIKLKLTKNSTDLFIRASLPSLQTIFRNLVNNAIKFTRKGGEVSMELYGQTDEVKFIIKDNGIGIPADKLDNLFDHIHYDGRPGTDGEKGTGLGLKLVHDFVKVNHGTIKVESEEGRGTLFTVIFPRLNQKLDSTAEG